jgi:hypothetical protein
VRPVDARVPVIYGDARVTVAQTAPEYFHRAEQRFSDEPDGAIADLDQAIRLDPSNAD